MVRNYWWIGAAIIALSLCSTLHGQTSSSAPVIPDNFYSPMQWRCIGPHRGGRVLAVAGVHGEPDTFYFGAVAGGVWKTTDAGNTWTPIFDGQPIASIGALAVSTSDPNVIYVGTGEAEQAQRGQVGLPQHRCRLHGHRAAGLLEQLDQRAVVGQGDVHGPAGLPAGPGRLQGDPVRSVELGRRMGDQNPALRCGFHR